MVRFDREEYEEVGSIIFHKGRVSYLITVLEHGEINISDIFREIKTTFSYASHITEELEELEIIETKKEGRPRYVKLTDKGVKIAESLKNVLDVAVE